MSFLLDFVSTDLFFEKLTNFQNQLILPKFSPSLTISSPETHFAYAKVDNAKSTAQFFCIHKEMGKPRQARPPETYPMLSSKAGYRSNSEISEKAWLKTQHPVDLVSHPVDGLTAGDCQLGKATARFMEGDLVDRSYPWGHSRRTEELVPSVLMS